jgi:hypothetical protein
VVAEVRRLVALLLLAVTLTGCSQQGDELIDIRAEVSKGMDMVKLYERQHEALTPDQAVQLVDDGHQVCAYLSKNPSLADLWRDMTDSGHSGDAAGTTILAGVTYLCPQFHYLYEGGTS